MGATSVHRVASWNGVKMKRSTNLPDDMQVIADLLRKSISYNKFNENVIQSAKTAGRFAFYVYHEWQMGI